MAPKKKSGAKAKAKPADPLVEEKVEEVNSADAAAENGAVAETSATTGAAKKKKNKKKAKKADEDDDDALLAALMEENIKTGVGCLGDVAETEASNDGPTAQPSRNGLVMPPYTGKPVRGDLPAVDNSVFRKLGNWAEEKGVLQTWPPTVPIDVQFKGNYPAGEEQPYKKSGVKVNDKEEEDREAEAREALFMDDVMKARRAAEAHRQVRRYAQSYIRPGLSMVDICQRLEQKTHELIQANGLEAGWGFPTGCSVNHCAAHYTPNPGDDRVLQQSDVVKFDFGTQVGGRIIDCAFTVAFDPVYDPAVECTIEATNTGLKEAGIDVRFSEIGTAIHEVIESYEVELNGKTYRMRPVQNLNGHNIGPYKIHGGKSVPIIRNEQSTRMEEGEFFAIETFASTGDAFVMEQGECSHYMINHDAVLPPPRLKSARGLLSAINQNFGGLAFCRRWLDDIGQTRHLMALKNLVDNEYVVPYPPLCDKRDSIVTQMEHTIVLRPTCKEILSRGPDY